MSREDKTFNMQKSVMRLIILGIALATIPVLNDLLLAVEAQKLDGNASFVTYNDTAYGFSINYPSNWQIDESIHQYMLSYLQNLSSSESQTGNDDLKSKISEILDAFGLGSISELSNLNPDERTEILQKMSQALNEGRSRIIASIISPLEGESDPFVENLNIILANISAESPISLKDYVNANIEGMETYVQNFTIIEHPMEVTIDGTPAMTLVYTGRNPVDESFYGKYLNLITINGETAYILTFTSPPETYSRYEPTFEKMLQSFRSSN